jgi:hypothetical protein
MHTSRTPRFLISDRTRSQYLAPFPVAVLPGPQAQHVTPAVHGDAQRQVDGPAGDLALADLHVNGIDEQDRVNGVQRAALPSGQAFHDPVGDRRYRLLRHLGSVHLGQVRGDLTMGQPFRRQGNNELVDPGQPPLPLGDNFRLETGIPAPRHRELHRPGLSQHSLAPVTVAGITAVAAGRVILLIAEMVIELALQGTLDHHLGQLAQQPPRTGQLQPAGAGPLSQLPQQLLISRRQLRPVLLPIPRNVTHLVSPSSQELHR